MPDPEDKQSETPTETKPAEPSPLPKASKRSSAKKSAPPSAKRSSKKKLAAPRVGGKKSKKAGANRPSAKSSKKPTPKKSKRSPGKAKAKRKASPKGASKRSSVKAKSRSKSRGASTRGQASTKQSASPKGRQGIRKDGKPRQTQKPPTSRADAVYGANVAVERRLKLMSQGALCKKLGIKQGYLSTIERGTNAAPAALKAKIKKVLGV